MTVAEMARYLDKTADYTIPNGLIFWVTISDVRMSWGKLQFEIVPLRGQGPAWVAEDSLKNIRDN